MPTTRTRRSRQLARRLITPDAVEAWRAGDFHGLARALGTKPWMPHPWPLELCALGVNDRPEPLDENGRRLWRPEDWRRAQDLQKALLEVAGKPGALTDQAPRD